MHKLNTTLRRSIEPTREKRSVRFEPSSGFFMHDNFMSNKPHHLASYGSHLISRGGGGVMKKLAWLVLTRGWLGILYHIGK